MMALNTEVLFMYNKGFSDNIRLLRMVFNCLTNENSSSFSVARWIYSQLMVFTNFAEEWSCVWLPSRLFLF